MSASLVEQIANAVLYEGYMLYPYRPSSVKNRQRWTFGGLYPPEYAAQSGEPASMQTQLLVESSGMPVIDASVRFLHLLERDDGNQEATPRETGPGYFEFPAMLDTNGGMVRRQFPVAGLVEVLQEHIRPELYRITIRVVNQSPV